MRNKRNKPLKKYRDHKRQWANCSECKLCQFRSQIVLYRGRLPCQVLFVGEAPGVSENLFGVPFYGPAGKLLDKIIAKAWAGLSVSWGFTNLVACLPKESKEKGKEPPLWAIQACKKRLQQIVMLAQPKGVVCVGALAEKHFQPPKGAKHASIVHPAAILRADVSQKGLAVQQAVGTVFDLARRLGITAKV